MESKSILGFYTQFSFHPFNSATFSWFVCIIIAVSYLHYISLVRDCFGYTFVRIVTTTNPNTLTSIGEPISVSLEKNALL